MEEEQNKIIHYYKDKYKCVQKKFNDISQQNISYNDSERHIQIEEGLNQRILELEDQIVMREEKIEE